VARVFLMSPPAPGWRILGAANYKSAARAQVNPRKALEEWLRLADAIVAAGGEVAVLPPPAAPALLTGLMYTANAGWLVAPDRFRVAHLSVAHRQAEQPYLLAAIPALLGIQVERSRAVWEGQADMGTIGADALILTYGVRSAFESVAEVQAALPASAESQPARLRQPFFHGDTCTDLLETPLGKVWLAFPGAFASPEEYRAVRRFAERRAEVVEIGESDALGYACNSLSIGGKLLAPEGLSSGLLGGLSRRGLQVEPLDFGELFGKGGGGPRCLVNELRGMASIPPPASYRNKRAAIVGDVGYYPTSA
jgi:N-dimethylarginine dimethylaminohydrolase